MKKTSQLSIGGSLFNIEEDAFEKLESYTNSIRDHFLDNSEKEEILQDIESRIAENFSESKNKIIILEEVELVIETMGTVEQFDIDMEDGLPKKTPPSKKQLYRDKDGAVLTGVSSGLGYFFGVNPVIFRIIFILLVLFGGPTGIIIYGILWFIVPEAKTSSQKLSMKGDPITLSSVSEIVKEKVREIDTSEKKSVLTNTFSFFVDLTQKATKVLLPVIRVSTGLLISLVSLPLIFATTVTASAALLLMSPEIINGPLIAVAESATGKVLLVATYLLLVIPFISIFIFGINLMTKRKLVSKTVSTILLSLWSIGIVVFFVAGPITLAKIDKILKTDPYYRIESQIIDTGEFNAITVTGNSSVKITKGEKYQVELKGAKHSLAKVKVANENGLLTLHEEVIETNSFLRCDECNYSSVEVIITTPNITVLSVSDSSYADVYFEGKDLKVQVDRSSFADFYVTLERLELSVSDSSQVELSGKVGSVKVDIKNSSRYTADKLKTDKMELQIVDSSSAEIYVTKLLNVLASNDSFVSYLGSPKVTEGVDDTSKVVPKKTESVGQ